MSKDTFAFSSAALHSLKVDQEWKEWQDKRQALAHRRAMSRPPVSRASRPPPRQQRGLQEIWVYEARCRDTTIHNTFMCGDMKGVHTVLKDPCMVNALMETVHEEMVWAPELGMWSMSSKIKQTSALRLAASKGHSGCVEELLFRGAEVDADPGGSTALHDACIGGHDSCVQLLLAHGADPDLLAEDGSAPLHLCSTAQTFQCAELLVTGGAEVNVLTSETKITPLHVVARRGMEEHVKLFLSHGADVSARNREGETPLNTACGEAERPAELGRYLRVVQMLLGAGADHCTAGRKHHTPLHNACSNCSPRIAEIVQQHGAKADMQNFAGYTPMDCLLQVVEDYPDQHPEAVARSLLNHGAKAGKSLMLKLCLLSPATLEVMLNCYAVVPSCEEWMQSIPLEIHETHQGFFDSVRQMTSQPRSLQHLCGCALRHHLGKGIDAAISRLDVPSSLMEYLLLRNDGEIR
ncbi:LOW QUALITY PROTEIN: ankyrin repeat and SOCS box protein 16-like [Oncorhynchus tshawytscha]|uniref:LOW QUALITY PROTEIN: ankyrin repeat and SOCS box protein 16-like n=1 Tax=Oncorhynchus tshawytscha TaxID=74940 RepID=UPI001C3D0376|nr:LOW QUALITY PROTEIN: ankyrin repeat and SOCS box protein 16-like [Oncorhynchus tshawytscha]